MTSVLNAAPAQHVLARLDELGKAHNPDYSSRVKAREAELGDKFYGLERAQIGEQAPLAVAPEVGSILYALTISRRPKLMVEFGTSLGLSTLYLAAALHDLDAGKLITAELLDSKARAAAENLEDAGVAARVEIRTGDARETLNDLNQPIDMLFLDGSNDLYLEILTKLEPQLADGAVIAADLSHGDPHHDRYRDYVTNPDNGYITIVVPLDAGLVVSTRV